MKIKFLGTGGGRYVTAAQERKTAGLIVRTEETQIHVDPGPGALMEAQEEKPGATDAVLASHGHLDHVNDANTIIEMMTELHDKPGAVFANRSCLEGYGEIEKWIHDYHQKLCVRTETMEEGSSYEFKDLKIESQEMFHSDPRAQGFTLETDERKIGFWTDTEYSDELTGFYEGCDTLIVYCTRPKGEAIDSHTSIDDIPDIVEDLDISNVIVTHFGYRFLQEDLEEQKEWLEKNIEPKVIFAEDGMEFPGDKKLSSFMS